MVATIGCVGLTHRQDVPIIHGTARHGWRKYKWQHDQIFM